MCAAEKDRDWPKSAQGSRPPARRPTMWGQSLRGGARPKIQSKMGSGSGVWAGGWGVICEEGEAGNYEGERPAADYHNNLKLIMFICLLIKGTPINSLL